MKGFTEDRRVALVKDRPCYPSAPPYDPSETYSEWPGFRIGKEENAAYRAVREALRYLRLDEANFGSPRWNPLSDVIRPGDRVVVKPNLVSHVNIGARAFGLTDTDSLVTHGSVLRAVIDYAAKALGGRGTLIVGDCPVQGTKWDQVVKLTGLDAIAQHVGTAFPGVDFQLRDYRLTIAKTELGWVSGRVEHRVEGSEYVQPDLGESSLLVPLMQRNEGLDFGVSQYPRWRMKAAHSSTRNVYVVSRDLLQPDVFINVPKLKAHQKAGVTCALKNLVGINGHKDCLPHFRFGSPKNGGDEYPDGNWLWDLMWACFHAEWEREGGLAKRALRLLSFVSACLFRVFGGKRHASWLGGGSWHGNDTLWRTVLDLNRLFFYFDPVSGAFGSRPREGTRYLAIVDGLIGGERESPLAPSPVACGWVMAAFNPAALDAVAATCMGFDVDKIPLIREAFALDKWPLVDFGVDEIELVGNIAAGSIHDLRRLGLCTPFTPSLGYRGTIEFEPIQDVPQADTVAAGSTR